ncbi:hypothetical protein HMPREF9579_00777 [Cutibacterium acnes HL087PA1]|nr:hypothetical protein HMPREF9616_00503 [Cutibacterium acnes HL007PA1]EFT73972.1 hypothetical protein HMPREF9592_01317 [Cutibacterium acnes HL046PA1]EGE93953.1 hypothetical protein HMPREF9570_01581 [Cutibacterium acnes HL043PA1]EGF03789.1 hypothetical protein HMPREF9584_00329 [Cutibacterium acnes HL092PA1]EGF69190.1 hypothetical protein HMPREF9579_00777 [Cutibacterium acnes HL087PA1]
MVRSIPICDRSSHEVKLRIEQGRRSARQRRQVRSTHHDSSITVRP